jgi:hypothetical protein
MRAVQADADELEDCNEHMAQPALTCVPVDGLAPETA